MKKIKTTPGYLDDIKRKFNKYSHFTVRNGKVKYHILHIADNSCGLYYAFRNSKDGSWLEGRRVLEPTDEITVWGD